MLLIAQRTLHHQAMMMAKEQPLGGPVSRRECTVRGGGVMGTPPISALIYGGFFLGGQLSQ